MLEDVILEEGGYTGSSLTLVCKGQGRKGTVWIVLLQFCSLSCGEEVVERMKGRPLLPSGSF
jgi:hypothetical protein